MKEIDLSLEDIQLNMIDLNVDQKNEDDVSTKPITRLMIDVSEQMEENSIHLPRPLGLRVSVLEEEDANLRSPSSEASPMIPSESISMGPLKKDMTQVQKWVNCTPPKRFGAQLDAVEYGQKGNANGVYLIRDENLEPKGIFKPMDEERGAPNYHKLDAKDKSKYGIEPGEGSARGNISLLFRSQSRTSYIFHNIDIAPFS